mgnify:FL=1
MDKPLFLALDFATGDRAKNFIREHSLQGIPVKVGMELFYREGPEIVTWLKDNGHELFFDLKLHDIPHTVEKAMANLAQLGVNMVNVHALGGSQMIQAAKRGLEKGAVHELPKLMAVTLLTSMDEETLANELTIDASIEKTAEHLAMMAKESGADGVVCSANEARTIKQACGQEFLTVTPGIRLQGSASNDQVRIATPAYAKQNGADYLVIGRTVTKADNPKQAYQQVVEEWTHA